MILAFRLTCNGSLLARYAYVAPGYPELLIETGLQVVRHGGRAEYNAIVAIHDKPPTPTARVAAMHVSLCLFNRGYF